MSTKKLTEVARSYSRKLNKQINKINKEVYNEEVFEKENPCLRKGKGFFEPKKYYKHDWAYKNKEERKCLTCGEVQIYFGKEEYDTETIEDWRKKTIEEEIEKEQLTKEEKENLCPQKN